MVLYMHIKILNLWDYKLVNHFYLKGDGVMKICGYPFSKLSVTEKEAYKNGKWKWNF